MEMDVIWQLLGVPKRARIAGNGNHHARRPPIFAFVKHQHTLSLTVALIFTVCSALIEPMMARVIGLLFQSFTSYGSRQISKGDFTKEMRENLGCFLIISLFSWPVHGLFFASWLVFGEHQVTSARTAVYNNLLKAPIDTFEGHEDGISAFTSRLHR